jgi:hypothetical protein
MNTDRRLGALRSAGVYIGLLASAFAGAFLLGAYAQGFATLDTLRDRGSDGYPWSWQAALLIGLAAALLAGSLGIALREHRARAIYWGLCAATGVLGAVIELADPSSTLTWLGFLGLPLVGMGILWLVSGMPRHTGGAVASP